MEKYWEALCVQRMSIILLCQMVLRWQMMIGGLFSSYHEIELMIMNVFVHKLFDKTMVLSGFTKKRYRKEKKWILWIFNMDKLSVREEGCSVLQSSFFHHPLTHEWEQSVDLVVYDHLPDHRFPIPNQRWLASITSTPATLFLCMPTLKTFRMDSRRRSAQITITTAIRFICMRPFT